MVSCGRDIFLNHRGIHYNPVKHVHVKCPHQWEHSSFLRWAKEGVYSRDWLCQCRENSELPDFGVISKGEEVFHRKIHVLVNPSYWLDNNWQFLVEALFGSGCFLAVN